jgi:hypothetical protein
MKALRFAYSLTTVTALWALLGTGSCGGLATGYGGSADASDASADDAPSSDVTVSDTTTEAPPHHKGCAADVDCLRRIPPTNPPLCATAACDVPTGTCVFSAKDEDGDGHPAADCMSTNGVAIVDGDDCDDHDPNLYPGHPENCSSLEDGGVITYPLGVPAGICQYGLVSCLTGGGISPCIGAVGPAPRDCASSADDDCDGRADDTECNCSLVPSPAVESCFPCAAPQKAGAGSCVSGTETCQPVAGDTMTTWGPCTGYQCATSDDTCYPGNDDNCDGIPNDPAGGCTCFDGMVQACSIAPGCTGMQVCVGGNWGFCFGTCPVPDAGPDVTPDVTPHDGSVCSATCKTNTDCAIECGTSPMYCCDIPTGVCFPPSTGVCIMPIDSGPDTNPY